MCAHACVSGGNLGERVVASRGELFCDNCEAHQALCITHTSATPMNHALGSHCLLPSV